MQVEAASDYLRNKLREIHEFSRHVFQLFVGWFMFFFTVNLATMGWLVQDGNYSSSLTMVSVFFVVQNVLGVGVCAVVRNYTKSALHQSRKIDNSIRDMITDLPPSTISNITPLPSSLYMSSVNFIFLALVVQIFAWSYLPFSADHVQSTDTRWSDTLMVE